MGKRYGYFLGGDARLFKHFRQGGRGSRAVIGLWSGHKPCNRMAVGEWCTLLLYYAVFKQLVKLILQSYTETVEDTVAYTSCATRVSATQEATQATL